MASQPDFPLVFRKLKSILQPYSTKLIVKVDTADAYSLDSPYSIKWKKEIFVGAVRINKNYVSFHLMPVYMFPDMVKKISPELKKHMQGKSCFNFKKIETSLFDELARLTRQGFERFMKENYFLI
jgi:hypothetical protein